MVIWNFYVSLRIFLYFFPFCSSPTHTPCFRRFLIHLQSEWVQKVQRSCVQWEIEDLTCLWGEAHLPGTKQKRWSGDSEKGTEEVLLSAPEPQSNLLEFHHRRNSWHKSGSTWGREIAYFKLCIFPTVAVITLYNRMFFMIFQALGD